MIKLNKTNERTQTDNLDLPEKSTNLPPPQSEKRKSDQVDFVLKEEESHSTSNSVKPRDFEPLENNEEPELTLEADLPSDGRDEEGEAMIWQLSKQS